MKEKHLALMVFVDENGETLLQDRTNMSKHGEEWGYFGGKIETGETPQEAVVREVEEELEFRVQKPTYLGKYVTSGKSLKFPDVTIQLTQEVFITRITAEDRARMHQHEGAGKKSFNFVQARRLNMYPLDVKILDDAEKWYEERK